MQIQFFWQLLHFIEFFLGHLESINCKQNIDILLSYKVMVVNMLENSCIHIHDHPRVTFVTPDEFMSNILSFNSVLVSTIH